MNMGLVAFSRRGSPLVRLAACLMSALVVGVLLAGPAEAHASLVGTNPAADTTVAEAPEAVELTFDEPVEPGPDGVVVLGPDGERTDDDDVEIRDDGLKLVVPFDGATIGTYTVPWRVVSDDGHTIEGSFVFHVGEARGGATLDDDADLVVRSTGWVGRWLAFTGGIMALGGIVFSVLVLGRSTGPDARLRRLMLSAAVTCTVGAALTTLARAAEASGQGLLDAPGLLPDLIGSTRYTRLDALWVVLGAALVATLLLPWVRDRLWVAGAVGVAFLAVPAFAGHAWTASPVGLAVVADIVHVLSVATWIGGLVALLVVASRTEDNVDLVRRFSSVALVAAGVTVLSGSISSWLDLGSVDALLNSAYGRLLLAKVCGVALILVLGYVNRSQLVGIAERSVDLLHNVRFEVAIAAVVIAITAGLVTVAPGREYEPPSDFSGNIRVEIGAANLDLSVTPARTGPNSVHLTFVDPNGGPGNMDAVEVRISTDGVPARKLELTTVTAYHFIAEGVSFSPAGTWQFAVTAVRSGEPATKTIEVPIS
jgi:copper transport protein